MTQEKIKAIMKREGINQKQLAKQMYCTNQRVSDNLRSGKKLTNLFTRHFIVWAKQNNISLEVSYEK